MGKNINTLENYDYLFSDECDEEQAKTDYEEYCRHMEDEMNDMLEEYLKYLDAAYDVKNETLKKHSGAIYNAINIVTEHDQHSFGFAIAGCNTLSDVLLELNRDLESSIFLSIHANYRAANILLRRWLDVTLTAIYLDSNLKKCKDACRNKNSNKKIKTYKNALAKCEKWLKTPNHISFKGEVINHLLDGDTPDKANELLNIVKPNTEKSFKEYVLTINNELNQHAHYGGDFPIPIDKMRVDFVEYDEKYFIEWYNRLIQIYDLCNIMIFLKFPEIIDLSEQHKDNEFISFPTLMCAQVLKLKEWQKLHASVS